MYEVHHLIRLSQAMYMYEVHHLIRLSQAMYMYEVHHLIRLSQAMYMYPVARFSIRLLRLCFRVGIKCASAMRSRSSSRARLSNVVN